MAAASEGALSRVARSFARFVEDYCVLPWRRSAYQDTAEAVREHYGLPEEARILKRRFRAVRHSDEERGDVWKVHRVTVEHNGGRYTGYRVVTDYGYGFLQQGGWFRFNLFGEGDGRRLDTGTLIPASREVLFDSV